MDWATYTIDFSQEGRRKVNLFSYVLGYSRRQYIHFTASQDLETTLREHVRAFEHLRGRCHDLPLRQYEGRGGPLRGWRADLQHPLPGLRHALWLPAGGLPSAAAADEGQSGAAILVHRKKPAQRPGVPLPGPSQRSGRLVVEGSGRRARSIGRRERRPIDLHAEELPHLIPLPERPYEVAEMVYRTVDAEGFIPYGNNRYSVPWHYLGQVLPVRITDEAVTIYSPRLELLARHVRFPPTERHRQSRQPEHLPPRDLVRRREVLRGRFAELGPLAVRFLEGLLAAQRCGWDHAQKVLTLLGIYRREDLLAALERAVRYGAFSAKSIERILAVQARPKTCWDRMAEEEPSHLGELLSDDPTPPRPATEYQHLLFEESDHDDQTEEKDDTDPEDQDEPF